MLVFVCISFYNAITFSAILLDSFVVAVVKHSDYVLKCSVYLLYFEPLSSKTQVTFCNTFV